MSALRDLSRKASLRRQRKKLKQFTQLALLSICVLVLITMFIWVFAAQPLMRWWTSMQSQSHVAVARAAIAQQDFTAALEAAQKAAAITPDDPELLRTWVKVLVGLNAHPDEVLSTLARVEAVGGMTPEMRLKRVEAQLHRGDMQAAQRALSELPEAQRQSWEAVALEATLLLRQGRTTEAGQRLQSSPEAANTPEAIFRRAVLDLAVSQDEAQRTRARQIIWQTARGDSASQRLALTLLSRDASLTANEAAELLDLVNQAPGPGPAAQELRHAVLEQVIRLSPERKEALIQAESERAADLPALQQVRHVLFLAQQQASQTMQTFLRDHERILAAERPADYVSLQLEILAKANDWPGVRQKLKTKAAGRLGRLSLNLWEANATAALTPDSPLVLEHLQLAYEATQNGRNLAGAIRVADVALNLRQHAFAAACYEELAAQPLLPGDKITLLEKAVNAHTETRDTPALRRTARALAVQTPDHLHNAYRADYLDILYGEGLEIISHRLKTQDANAAANVTIRAHQRLLNAMIFCYMKHQDMLRRELTGLENATTWTAGERAVLAGLLAKAGEPARAWQLAEKLPESLLLNEEAALLAVARK
jgi:hypothetical protein